MGNDDYDCGGSWSDTVLCYTFLVNAMLSTNMLATPTTRLEQTFHVRASSWIAKAELNYDVYGKQRVPLTKLKECVETMLDDKD
ncbi:unnamed protein product [Clonostachys rosea]|uniref:Uncharacterized protein n=1 Tax=Bionectria ochroleuca TaxID=29856 RepID=A0ABY6TUT1_BIOOC|nr:unnamed protein product [Clonostachys rosea]